ncbi:MAG TPA: carboxypeptidase regulatory-like domain-containing protein [Firmicutes bacterium]|nr:carboxypeptidase regulatory-like domain-containing protein [Bacillota bacterium]
MLRLVVIIAVTVTLAVLVIGNLASCSGASAVNENLNAVNATESGPQVAEEAPFADFPPIPLDGIVDGAAAKGASWLYNVDPTMPFLSHRTMLCPLHPDCLQLIGLQSMPLTHVPPPPYFAYAFYQLPVGANEVDLEKLHLYGAVENAGDKYYVALANFSAMAWQWYGPGTGDYTIDFSTVAYDFTGPAGNAYIAVVVPAYDLLHLWGIELEYANDPNDPTDPEYWNVWGIAYDSMIPGAAPIFAPGETVTFESTLTGIVFSTMTSADGAWGTNLPTGTYKFNVTNNKHLFDPGAFLIVDDLPVILELNAGQMIYHGPNAAYDGNVIPMPLITLNVF